LQVSRIHRGLEHGVRAIVALLALALVAGAISACGGSAGANGNDNDARTLLQQTFTGTHKLQSGKVDALLRVSATGDPSIKKPIRVTIAGPFASAGPKAMPKFDLALDVSAQGQGLQAGLVSTSDRLFVNFGGTSYEVPASLLRPLKKSFASSKGQGGLNLGGLHLQPMNWLKNPTVEGDQTIDGTATTHISAQLDVEAFLNDLQKVLTQVKQQGGAAAAQLPSQLSGKDRKQIEDAVKRATLDVWTGKSDKTLRKVAVAVALVLPKGTSGSGGPTSVNIAFTATLKDLNQPQTIKAPATSRPLSELLSQIQGFLAGALSGAGGGSLGGGTSGKADAYAQCLSNAGSDVQKAQACASLLTR
jgi:hypothetical protein